MLLPFLHLFRRIKLVKRVNNAESLNVHQIAPSKVCATNYFRDLLAYILFQVIYMTPYIAFQTEYFQEVICLLIIYI